MLESYTNLPLRREFFTVIEDEGVDLGDYCRKIYHLFIFCRVHKKDAAAPMLGLIKGDMI